jgi:hypothetical protein
MADNSKMKGLILTFILIVVGLALTPTIGAFAVSANYTYAYQENTLVPHTSNVTSVSYNIRETDEVYVTIIALNKTDSNTTIPSTDYSYTVTGAKAITIANIVSDAGSSGHEYYLLITYQTIDLTSSVIVALTPLVPIFWVVVILAVGVTAIYVQLKKVSG